MDEMRIVTDFTRGMISRIARTVIKKKFGYNIDILLNSLDVTVKDGETHLHIDLDANMSNQELLNILKSLGLN